MVPGKAAMFLLLVLATLFSGCVTSPEDISSEAATSVPPSLSSSSSSIPTSLSTSVSTSSIATTTTTAIPAVPKNSEDLPSCGENYTFFQAPPVDLQRILGIAPLGNLNPPGHTFPTMHTYFYIERGPGGEDTVEIPLNSPGDVWITGIRSSERLSESPPTADYVIYFTPCREFNGYFGHVTSISEKLLKEFNGSESGSCNQYMAGGKEYRSCSKQVMLRMGAGEPLGTAGGQKGQYALDFGAWDTRTPVLPYANPSRWQGQAKNVVCPISYFSDGPRSQIEPLFGKDRADSGTLGCGEVEQDEPGTAAGIWFLKGTTNTYPEDPNLALVHDNYLPSKGAFSIGTSVPGVQSGRYLFAPLPQGSINLEFSDVMPGSQVYCYEPEGRTGFTILLKLSAEGTLKMGKGSGSSCGTGPWQFSDSAEFER